MWYKSGDSAAEYLPVLYTNIVYVSQKERLIQRKSVNKQMGWKPVKGVEAKSKFRASKPVWDEQVCH